MSEKIIKTTSKSEFAKMDDLKDSGAIHLAGIGGSAMNGLALILKSRGYSVTGTDPNPSVEVKRRLEKNGIPVHTVQDGSKIPKNTQLLITTAALPSNHAELTTAANRGIPIMKYADMLGLLLNDSDGVAVAGTHGKTTTTAFTVAALNGANIHPGFLVGSVIPELGSSAGIGDSPIFVAEACEYDRSFLKLKPKRAIITNIDADHLDIYKDLDEILATFKNFAAGIPKEGALIYNSDCDNARAVAEGVSCRTISFSCIGPAQIQASNISHGEQVTRFELHAEGKMLGECTIQLPGGHNVSNALAALAVGIDMGFPPQKLIEGTASLGGVKRRFELIGEFQGITIIDDYAHHPTEIRALLRGAAERYPNRRLIVAFQPHQLSRTRLFFNDFASAFRDADLVLLAEVFAARDEGAGDDRYSSKALSRKISSSGVISSYHPSLDDVSYEARAILKPGDVFITVGAGNIYKVASNLAKVLSNTQ